MGLCTGDGEILRDVGWSVTEEESVPSSADCKWIEDKRLSSSSRSRVPIVAADDGLRERSEVGSSSGPSVSKENGDGGGLLKITNGCH